MCPVALFSLVRIYAEHHSADQWVMTTAAQAQAYYLWPGDKEPPESQFPF